MTLAEFVDAGSFGKNDRTVAEIARWMYLNGYDFRHFLVMGITPAVIEIVLRGYILLRHYRDGESLQLRIAQSPKYRSMLLTAHSIATLGNAGKVALLHGNPLAINQAEWMVFFRYLLPTLKYWLFDRQRLRLQHLERISGEGWDELVGNSNDMLRLFLSDSLPVVSVGQLH
jgi:hypothetical protein